MNAMFIDRRDLTLVIGDISKGKFTKYETDGDKSNTGSEFELTEQELAVLLMHGELTSADGMRFRLNPEHCAMTGMEDDYVFRAYPSCNTVRLLRVSTGENSFTNYSNKMIIDNFATGAWVAVI